jgi:hypothetical protein
MKLSCKPNITLHANEEGEGEGEREKTLEFIRIVSQSTYYTDDNYETLSFLEDYLHGRQSQCP